MPDRMTTRQLAEKIRRKIGMSVEGEAWDSTFDDISALIDAHVSEELERAAERALEAMWTHDWNAGNLPSHVSDAFLGGWSEG